MKPDITLIFPSSPFLIDQKVFPPLGIMYLSAYLKQEGFSVQCLDMAFHNPDMAESDTIGISITTPQREEAYKLAEYYKGQGKVMIAGGPHASHMPEECLKHGFDCAVEGEGEESLPWIIATRKTYKKFLVKKTTPPKKSPIGIDDYPFPDRDALPIKDYKYLLNEKPTTVLMSSRGCPYNCSFCARINKRFRMQSAERTIDEIFHINKKYEFEAFMFFDDVFIANKKRLNAIAEGLRDKNFIFRCFGRADLIDNETCEILKKMNVVEVGLGIESGSDEVLEKNLKGTTRAINLRAVKRLHKYGIRVKAFLIVGLPGETTTTIAETSSWIQEAWPDDVDISIFQPLPGSSIFADPKRWGVAFSYDGRPGWYKGQPGKYESTISTQELSAAQIVAHRNLLEFTYKKETLLK